MQKAAVRRLLSSFDLVGSLVLVVAPLVGHAGASLAFPGLIALLLSAASFYWSRGDFFTFSVGVSSLMLFGAYEGFGAAFWGSYSNLGGTIALGASVLCALIGIGFLFEALVASGFSKDQK